MSHVALALAKYTYFGKPCLESSTVTGKEEGSQKLNPVKLTALKNDLRSVFPEISPTEFEPKWKSQIINSFLGNYCRRLRYNWEKWEALSP